MARSARSSELENRTSRLKLKPTNNNEPYWVRIAPGLFLGYYRPAGTWWARKLRPGTKLYAKTSLDAAADDYRDANGADVLTYYQAQDKARRIADEHAAASVIRPTLGACTVADACKEYVESIRADRGDTAATDAEQRLNKHVTPKLGKRPVNDLSLTETKRWRDALVRGKDAVSKSTANRILANFKAALNSVFADDARGIPSDRAWRALKAFRDADSARQDHFQAAEVQKLIDEAEKFDRPFSNLLAAGFLTGARYGELAACDVRHFDPQRGVLTIPSGKTGARAVTLMTDATAFFVAVAADRPGTAPLLPGTHGGRWGKSDQHRRIKRALKAAELPQTASFYALRHSYISRAIEADVPLYIVARNCGTSESMIRRHYAKLLAEKERVMLERAAGAFRLSLIPGGKVRAEEAA